MCVLGSLSPKGGSVVNFLATWAFPDSLPWQSEPDICAGDFWGPDTGQFSDASLEPSMGGWGTRGWPWAQVITPAAVRVLTGGQPQGAMVGRGVYIEEMARRFLFNQIPPGSAPGRLEPGRV